MGFSFYSLGKREKQAKERKKKISEEMEIRPKKKKKEIEKRNLKINVGYK